MGYSARAKVTGVKSGNRQTRKSKPKGVSNRSSIFMRTCNLALDMTLSYCAEWHYIHRGIKPYRRGTGMMGGTNNERERDNT